MNKLKKQEIDEELTKLNAWSLADNKIEKALKFKDFVETFAFMTQIALLAERMGHHPDWTGGYNELHIALTTHSAGGLTRKDFELAKEIDRLLKNK